MPRPKKFSDLPEYEELLIVIGEAIALKGEVPAITLAELIGNMYSSGMSKEAIRAQLLKDLREGGPIFGGFRKAFTSTFTQSIERSSQLVMNSVYRSDLPRDQLYSWVMTKDNNCEDCIERSQRDPQTLEEWELEGLPQSGVTVCGLNCGCKLVPEGVQVPVDDREVISSTE